MERTSSSSLAGLFDDWPASIQALPDVDTIQLLEVRRMFEPAAAALAASTAAAHISAIEHELVCRSAIRRITDYWSGMICCFTKRSWKPPAMPC